jgi:hypothetical protein
MTRFTLLADLESYLATDKDQSSSLAQDFDRQSSQLTPVLALLHALLADAVAVRDRLLWCQVHSLPPQKSSRRQYERDLRGISADEERVPCSFGWVCLALGLEPAAVRRVYLSGRPVRFERHTAAAPPCD